MSELVGVEGLSKAITSAVQAYTEDVATAIKEEIDDTAKAVATELKEVSPKDTGEYAKGWAATKSAKGGEYKQTVHNKKKPWLVHILEFGHAKVGGGRVDGRPHLQPTYDKHAATFETKVKKIIESGGKR